MTREDRLAELLERWEEASTNGPSFTAEDLCHDCPDLLDDFRKLLGKLGPVNAVLAGNGVGDVPADEYLPEVDAGRYRPISFHARGGLGMVFSAEDGEIGRRVALKCMQRLPASDAASRRRFLFEAEITGRLEHPGIVPVYGLGQDARGKPFYAMRFIQGQTLGEAIEQFHRSSPRTESERNVEQRRLLRHFVAVCETMAYAHDQGVVHRDLKPANIMIGPYGETLVVDWGLAKRVGSNELSSRLSEIVEPPTGGRRSDPSIDLTIQGQAKGSPAYMSPEQARGEWGLVGPASDVYSLGSTLYVLLTGRKPYEGHGPFEVIEAVQRGRFLPPRAMNPSTPRPLEAICLKAMAFAPAERYATSRDFAKDLERWLADEPVAAWREPFVVRARRWLKGHRSLVTSSVAMLMVGLFAALAYGVQERRHALNQGRINDELAGKNRLLDQAKGELTTKNFDLGKVNQNLVESNRVAEENRRQARRNQYPAVMNIVSTALEDQQFDRAAGLLREVAPAPGEMDDHRRFEWFCGWNDLEKARRGTLTIAANPRSMQISADGRVLAAYCGSDVVVYRVADGERLLTLPATRFQALYALSRDGRFLAFVEGQNIEIWDLPAEGRPTSRLTIKAFEKKTLDGLAISPDGQWIVGSGDYGKLRVWSAADGKRLHDIDQFVNPDDTFTRIEDLSISRDREWFAFRKSYNPYLFHLPTRKTADFVEANRDAGGFSHIRITEADRVCLIHVPVEYRGGSPARTSQVWSWPLPPPNGELLTITCTKRIVPGNVAEVCEGPMPNEGPVIYTFASKRLLGYRTPLGQDRPILMLRNPTTSELSPVSFAIAAPLDVSAFTVRPDGRVLVCADRNGRIVLLDAERASRADLLLRHPGDGPISSLAFMPDDRLISVTSDGALIRAKPGEASDWSQPRVPLDPNEFPRKGIHASYVQSPDGRWFAFRTKGQIDVANPDDRHDHCTLQFKQFSHFGSKVPMAFVPDRAMLVLASERQDGRTYSFVDGKPSSLMLWDFGAFRESSRYAAWLGGVAVARQVEARIFPKTIRELLVAVQVYAIDVSPNGRWIAAACRDGGLRVYSVDKFSGNPVRQFRASAALTCVRISPDSRFAAAGAADGSVWIFPLVDASEPVRISAHREPVAAILFDRDGTTIISGGTDGLVKFLIRELPQERFTIDTRAPIEELALSADGLRLAVGDTTGYVRLYQAATPSDVLRRARERWKTAGSEKGVARDFLLALWGSYLEKQRLQDVIGARALLDEAIEAGKSMDESTRKEFERWLQSFENEISRP